MIRERKHTGHGPLLVLRHDLRSQHAEKPPQSQSGTEARDLGPGALGGDRSRPGSDVRARPGRARATASIWARLRVCRDIPVARKRVLRLMRENNLLSPHRCRRRGGNPHDGEIITHAPNLMWGRWRSGVHGGRRLGRPPPSSIGTPSVSAGMSDKRGDRFAALQPISIGLAGLMARPRPARLGGWPSDGSRLESICRTTSPTDQVLGHPAVLRLRRRAPDQRRRRAVQSHAEGTDHPWSHLPQHRGAKTPSATSSNSTMPSGSSKRTDRAPLKLVRRGDAAISIRPAA